MDVGRLRSTFILLTALVIPTLASATARPPAGSLAEFERRAARCQAGNLTAFANLAAWAESHGLPVEADRMYRAIVRRDPSRRGAREGLIRLARGRPLPKASTALASTQEILPARFIRYETARFVVLSDADAGWTRDQAERLERTHHQFRRFADRLDLAPLPLEHKLVCVLFEDRADYRDFAVNHDEVTDPWIAGYYSPRHDRVVFYRGEANPSVVDARDRLRRMQDELDAITDAARVARREGHHHRAESLAEFRDRYRRHLHREASRVDEFARQVSIATLVHETTHQLLFHTRVQSPHLAYPVWISEGLATAFETDDTSGAFGPDFEYGPRRKAFDELLREGRVIDVEMLAVLTSAGSDDETVHAVYHSGYALVTWMSRFRRDELRTYLDLLAAEPSGSVGVDRALDLFEEAFGNAKHVQRAWLRHERTMAQASAN